MATRGTALIVGAGIGGLAAGLALRGAGWDIRIFERAAKPLELGFGIGLAPNAAGAIRELGVGEAVLPHRIAPLRGEMRWSDGRLLRRLAISPGQLRGQDPPALMLRQTLHGALLEAVGPAPFVLGREAAGFEIRDGRPLLRLVDGSTATGDILIGADGIRSIIRAQLHPDEPPPRPSGYCALRGASPALPALDGLQFIGYRAGYRGDGGPGEQGHNLLVPLAADGRRRHRLARALDRFQARRRRVRSPVPHDCGRDRTRQPAVRRAARPAAAQSMGDRAGDAAWRRRAPDAAPHRAGRRAGARRRRRAWSCASPWRRPRSRSEALRGCAHAADAPHRRDGPAHRADDHDA